MDRANHLYRSQNTVVPGAWYHLLVTYNDNTGLGSFNITPTGSSTVLSAHNSVPFDIKAFRYAALGYYGPPDYGTDWSSVRLDNLSLQISGSSAIRSYEWDYGDGTLESTKQAPVHVYTSIGTYNWIFQSTTLGEACISNGAITIVNRTPTVTSIFPLSATTGGTDFALTVRGTDFVDGSIVQWNGSELPTVLVDNTQLTAVIPAANIALPGIAGIVVANPKPEGGTSNTQPFTIYNPIPTVTNISPASITTGNAGSDFTLNVTGANFVIGSIVRWNGSDRATTFVSSTQLTASIPASDIVLAGTATITVFNRAPGGGDSTGITFRIGGKVFLPLLLR